MNISDIILGGGIGVLIALVLALPALLSELSRKSHTSGSHIALPDVNSFMGRKLKDRETLALGLLIQLLAGLAYGLVFPLTVSLRLWEQIQPYTVLSHAIYAFIGWLFLGCVIFPALGFGIMGYKEDAWMWFEVLVTTTLMGVMFAVVVNWFQPFWF